MTFFSWGTDFPWCDNKKHGLMFFLRLAQAGRCSEGAAMPKRKRAERVYLKPSQIQFSHDAVGAVFGDGKHSIKDTFLQMHRRELNPEDVETMYVVEHQGRYVSMSNRRLAVYRLPQMYGKKVQGHDIQVPVVIGAKRRDFHAKNTTKCNGEYVYIRHTDFYIDKNRATTNFDPFQHKLSKPSSNEACECCESDNDYQS